MGGDVISLLLDEDLNTVRGRWIPIETSVIGQVARAALGSSVTPVTPTPDRAGLLASTVNGNVVIVGHPFEDLRLTNRLRKAELEAKRDHGAADGNIRFVSSYHLSRDPSEILSWLGADQEP